MTFSVKDLCERFAVGEHTILGWIKRGELKAIDVSRKQGGRPKWRIKEEALVAFEQQRTPMPMLPQKRRRKQSNTVIEFY